MEQMWVILGVFVIVYGLCSFFRLPFVKRQMLENYTEESVDKYCRYCGIPMMLFGVGFIVDAYSAAYPPFSWLRWVLYTIGLIPVIYFSYKFLERKNNTTPKMFKKKK